MTEISTLWLYVGFLLRGRVIGPKVTCNSLRFQNDLHIISRRRLEKQKQEWTLASHWHQYDKLAPSSLVLLEWYWLPFLYVMILLWASCLKVTMAMVVVTALSCSKSLLFLGEHVLLVIILVKYHSKSPPPPVTCGNTLGSQDSFSHAWWREDVQNLLWDGERVGAGRILPPDEGFANSVASQLCLKGRRSHQGHGNNSIRTWLWFC